jgi:hypothetical protein
MYIFERPTGDGKLIVSLTDISIEALSLETGERTIIELYRVPAEPVDEREDNIADDDADDCFYNAAADE